MKQLIANRSGATPTLDEVPNETIKIYDNDQDLDVDISNLEENEIVATKDSSGSAADIVESLKEYVDEQIEPTVSYSTTETKTGGYWIDGKPTYRQVITTNARTIYDNWNTVALDASVHTDYVIKCDMVSTSKNGTGGAVSANIKALVYADGTVHINNQYSNVNNTVYAIIEYTKTTD